MDRSVNPVYGKEPGYAMNQQDNNKITASQYFSWIEQEKASWYSLRRDGDSCLILETEYGEAQIRFYEPDIIEISITRKKDGKLRYYLHFQLKTKEHAMQMFKDMEDALLSLQNEKTLQVLLSCTSGATTSFLAGRLNQEAEQLGLDWHFDAVPYLQAAERAEKADMLLIAPQIAYLKNSLQKALPGKLIRQIPTGLFSAFDAAGMIDFIRNLQQNETKKEIGKEETASEKRLDRISDQKSILAITIVLDNEQLYSTFRYYHQGKLVEEEKAVFVQMKRRYLWQQISYMLRSERSIDWIVIATPGVVSDYQVVSMRKMNMDHLNLAHEIEQRYHCRSLIINNVNAAALGFYHRNPDYRNLVFVSSPYGCSSPGLGIIQSGLLVNGRRGIAGETKFFMDRMQFSNNPDKLSRTEEGQMEILTHTALPVIALLDPDIIVFRSPMVRDMKELYSHLKAYIEEEYIPKLIFIDNSLELIFEGLISMVAKQEN